MEHIGIDLGAKHSHLVVLSETGVLTRREKIRTAQLPAWLEEQPQSRIVLEACTQSPAIAKLGRQAGHEMVIVPGNIVRALGVGARSIKTDDRDAEVLAQASFRNLDLKSVHVRSDLSRSRREVLAARATHIELRKVVSTSIKSWLRGRLQTVKARANSKFFAAEVRKRAMEHVEGLPASVEAMLQTYEHLCDQIDQLDEQAESLTEQDETIKKLMSIPGVGPIVALSFITHLDTPERFSNGHDLASYLALIPSERTTGGRIRRGATITAGPTYLKALLVQAAWAMWRHRPGDPMVVWAKQIEERRGRRIAIMALARKLATVMWSMWNHGTSYDPSRASKARASQLAATLGKDTQVEPKASRRATTAAPNATPITPDTHVAAH